MNWYKLKWVKIRTPLATKRNTTKKRTKAKTDSQSKAKRLLASDAKCGKLRSTKERREKPWALKKVTQNLKRKRNRLSRSSEGKNPYQNLRAMRSRTQTTLN